MSDANVINPSNGYSSWTPQARWGLLTVLVIAAATRLVGLGSLDLWLDEVYSHDASSDLLPKLLRWETASNESSSPLPFIEQKFARQAFGEGSPLSLRLPSAMHGIATVLFLYLFMGYCVGWGAAFWSALLLAINPFALEWSREGRMYTQWSAATMLLIAIALEAVRWTVQASRMHDQHAAPDAQHAGPIVLNWRWWLMGIVFMLVHATNVMGTMTIGGVGLWLGLMGLVELRAGRAGIRILLGSALATAVYLCSWGLTGIAKMVLLAGGKTVLPKDFTPPSFTNDFLRFLEQICGHAPTVLAIALWALALAGLVLMVRNGKWRIALLIVMAGLVAWVGFPKISKAHFFTPRYVYTGVLTYCVGLGALAAWLAGCGKWVGRIVALALVVSTAAIAWPYTYEVFAVPKLAVRQALNPVQTKSSEGDVIILVPDYYESLDGYKPYAFSKRVTIVRGPKSARYGSKPDKDYKATFEQLYPTAHPEGAKDAPKAPPAGTWLFMLVPGDSPRKPKPVMQRWDDRLAEIEPVLAAYHLKPDDIKERLNDDTYTVTFRLSLDDAGKGMVEHFTPTKGRHFR